MDPRFIPGTSNDGMYHYVTLATLATIRQVATPHDGDWRKVLEVRPSALDPEHVEYRGGRILS